MERVAQVVHTVHRGRLVMALLEHLGQVERENLVLMEPQELLEPVGLAHLVLPA